MGSSLQEEGAIVDRKMKAQIIFVVALVAYVTAQDTFYCQDGWELFQREGKEGMDECSCYLFPTTLARVSHGDAKLAEPLDGAPNNYWIVDQLQTRLYENNKPEDFEGLEGPRYDDIWWMGGKSYTKHDSHNPGEWVWETANTTIEWFDWAPNQPDDWHRQQCLTYLHYNYFGVPTYQWNDWDCNTVADYICEKPCEKFA